MDIYGTIDTTWIINVKHTAIALNFYVKTLIALKLILNWAELIIVEIVQMSYWQIAARETILIITMRNPARVGVMKLADSNVRRVGDV